MTDTFSPKQALLRRPEQLNSRQSSKRYISSKGKCLDIVAYCQSQNSQRSN